MSPRRSPAAKTPPFDPANAIDVAAIEAPREDELLVVVGATATGKTDLAIELCERWNGEIVSADSVQIYREFKLGTGKPTEAERQRAPHHLIDVCDPLESFDARRFADLADFAISSIRARGKTPIVAGGTFLWVKALLFGLAEAPEGDPAVRARHRAIAESEGRAALHRRLADVDPASAARLAPNDLLRVSRALEVFELSGKPMSAWHAEHAFAVPRYGARLLGVARSAEELDQRIAARTELWLGAGWMTEVQSLIASGYGESRAMGSVGFRQIHDHLKGALTSSELESAIVRATRVFARRQRTWLRDQPVTWVRRS